MRSDSVVILGGGPEGGAFVVGGAGDDGDFDELAVEELG